MANRYWVAPATGNWSNTTNWSATSGGTGGASVPGVGDTVLFDSGIANCIVDVARTVDAITTTGYNGNLITLEPLQCQSLEWAGKQLLLAESKIGTLSVKRSNSSGSTVVFDPFGGKSHAAPPTVFNVTPLAGGDCQVSWAAVPGATNYYVQRSLDNGATWTQISTSSSTSRTSPATPTQDLTWRVAVEINGVLSKYSGNVYGRSLDGVALRGPVTSPQTIVLPSVPTEIGTFEVLPGPNAITINNQTEVRLTGDVTIQNGVTMTQASGSKFTLLGTQNQMIASQVNLEYSLNKPAGTLTLTAQGQLRSDLLRDPGEVDPRTATLLDIVVSSGTPISMAGDVACRSLTTAAGFITFVNGSVILDTYSFNGTITGTGTVRVCQGQYTNTGGSAIQNNQHTIVYWTDSTPTPPAKPNQIFASDQRVTEIDLWWNTVNDATSYVLERTTNYGNPSSWLQAYSGSTTSCTDSGLTPGTQYYYRLKAVNANGDSNWSPMLAAATDVYGAPENLVVTKVTADSIAVQWKSKYNPLDHLVAWSPNGMDSWTEIQTSSPSSFVFSGLTPETTYYFRVRARYTSANSPWSQVVSAKTLPLPDPVNTSDTWSVTKRISQKFEIKTDFFGDRL